MINPRSQERIAQILSKEFPRSKTPKVKKTFQPQPIEQTIFMRNMLAIYGNQKKVTTRSKPKALSILTNNQLYYHKEQNLRRAYSTKSQTTATPLEGYQLARPKTQTCHFAFSEKANQIKQDPLVSENELQKQKYSMLHYSFVNLQKKHQNIYGIPISEFLKQNFFITLISQKLLIELLSIFDINFNDLYEIVPFKKFKLFKQVIVWKDLPQNQMIAIVIKLFQDKSGNECLELIQEINNIQPVKYFGRNQIKRNMDILRTYVYEVQNVIIKHVLSNGNLSTIVNLENFRSVFTNRKLNLFQFIDALSGQLG